MRGDTRVSQISDLLVAVVRGQVADRTRRAERAGGGLEGAAAPAAKTPPSGSTCSPLASVTVLRLRYEGSSVTRIADTFEVARATVRTRVKAVLRKLDVNTQLAAVAAFDDALDLFDLREADGLPTPHRVPG